MGDAPGPYGVVSGSVTGLGDDAEFLARIFVLRLRGASRRHRILPVARSRQSVSSLSPSAAVRKTWLSVSAGEECPGGDCVFQITFFSGPISIGSPVDTGTPDPLGARNPGQSTRGFEA